jgi:hypothetical protein
MTRNQFHADSVQIYVFKEGVNVVPIITSPQLTDGGGYMIYFNASQSYVVNCSANMEQSNFSVGTLDCIYILAPGEKDLVDGASGTVEIRWKEVEDFIYRRVIDDGWIRGDEESGVEWNSDNYDSNVVFSQTNPEAKLRRIVMEMKYEA